MTGLSVIIVSYKGWNRLERCLEPLVNLRELVDSEIIVVDNDSGGVELEHFRERFSEFTFIRNNVNGGFANGCNTGARYATRPYLLFLNPDTVASPVDISGLLAAAVHNPGFSIVSCRQVSDRGRENSVSGSFPAFRNLTGILRAVFPPLKEKGTQDVSFPDWISGSVVLIRKELFEKLGGFDEDFWMYYEDVDLCKRAAAEGGKTALVKNITIKHNHGGSSRINLKTASVTKAEVHVSRHVYISKHWKGIQGLLMQSFMVVNNMITSAVMAVPGLVLFFIPKAFLRAVIFFRLTSYYLNALLHRTWISPRSVNYPS